VLRLEGVALATKRPGPPIHWALSVPGRAALARQSRPTLQTHIQEKGALNCPTPDYTTRKHRHPAAHGIFSVLSSRHFDTG